MAQSKGISNTYVIAIPDVRTVQPKIRESESFFCASLSNQMSLSFSKISTMTENARTHNGAQPYLKTPRDLLKDGGVEFLGAKIRIFSKAKIR